MHGSQEHSHMQHNYCAAPAGPSLLRMSATARVAVASVLAAALWLLVYAVTR